MDPFLHREPTVVPGYPADFQNTFEDLIDCFTPMDDIPPICEHAYGVPRDKLEKFCNIVYGMNFKESFVFLHKMSLMYYRKALTNLAKVGNKTAMSTVTDYMAELSNTSRANSLKISISGYVPREDDKGEK